MDQLVVTEATEADATSPLGYLACKRLVSDDGYYGLPEVMINMDSNGWQDWIEVEQPPKKMVLGRVQVPTFGCFVFSRGNFRGEVFF